MKNNINFTFNTSPYAGLETYDRNDVTKEFTDRQRLDKLSLSSDKVAGSHGSEVADAVRSLMASGKLSFASTAGSMRKLLNTELSENSSRCA